MSGTTTPTSGRHPYLQFLELPAAAGVAIVPNFWGWIYKSCGQLNVAKPPFGEALVRGVTEGAPAVAAVVGGQLLLIEKVEGVLKNVMSPETTQFSLTSAGIVGAGTSPLLAIYNGKSMGMGMMESVRSLNGRIVVAIATRETGFLGALNVVPGDNYPLTFAGAAFGSLVTHPADTAHTLWQRGLTIKGMAKQVYGNTTPASIFRTMFAGATPRFVGVGGFAVCLKIAKSFFCTTPEEVS